MAQQKKGLIARMLEGKERSEEYARSTLPTNRWQLFFDIFKGNFGKLVKINLLTLIFFVPMIAVIIFSMIYKEAMGGIYPFAANMGVGYPVAPDMLDMTEMFAFQTDATIFILLTISSVIAAVGLSGGMYVIRNMVWTEGIFVANDFWRGVKLNFKNALQTALFFMIILTLSVLMQDLVEMSRVGADLSKFHDVMLSISTVVTYVFLGLSVCMSFWMIALGVNYKMGFLTLIKNSFLMSIGMFPQTIFFGLLSLLPYLLFLIAGPQGFFLMAGIIIVMLFGLSFTLLVWLDFAQWAFDKYINPKIEGAKVGRGIYDRNALSAEGDNSEATLEYHRVILAAGKSQLVARPIKPIDDDLRVYDLPPAYTREDLKKLKESKDNIQADTDAYAEEHKNDERYLEYNRQFEERERALKEAEEGKKRKKRKAPRILNDKK